jgi:excisionase family DNA binding protein
MPASFRDRTGPAGRARMRTVKRAAEELDVNARTLWRAINHGELIVHRFGRAVRIADDDFRRYVASKRQA